jgi:hypothetical protein
MDYDRFTITVDELREWLATQPGKALVVVNPGDQREPFGVTGHAPAAELPFETPVVVLTP